MLTTTHYDVGDGVPPSWLPVPPGCALTPRPTYYNHPVERTGSFEIVTARQPAELYSLCRESIVSAGFEVDVDSEIPFPTGESVGMGMFSATRNERAVSVLVARQAREQVTVGSLAYKESVATSG